jgi:hypothetical protein
MNSLAYSLFTRREYSLDQLKGREPTDVFLSAFNTSDRVKCVFESTNAACKCWVVHNEYNFEPGELPIGGIFKSDKRSEAEFVLELIDHIVSIAKRPISELTICVDITGFMRPHILFLLRVFESLGVRQFDVLYSEPERYSKKENTTFSEGSLEVRQIAGFEGTNSSDQSNDFLIIGSGYDHRLIKSVAEHKDKTDKVQIFGLPSLRADMYQENVLRAEKAADAIGSNKTFDGDKYFAPANDPFSTAGIVSEIVRRREKMGTITNLYLSPLATKPQALGFGLYYLGECMGRNASIHKIREGN